jgi:hypothetical protein
VDSAVTTSKLLVSFLKLDLQSLDESWRPFLGPNGFSLDVDSIVEFRSCLALGSNDDNTNTSTFKCSACKRSDTRGTTWSEIDGVSSGGREVASFCPMDVLGEDLVAERGG